MENSSLALEMLKEVKAQSKRWFISFIIVLMLWFATIGVFIWYINQPIEEVDTETTTVDGGENGVATYLENSESGDINYGENYKN